MEKIKLLNFQKKAVEELSDKFVDQWSKDIYKTPLLLKAPTGSGKTLIVSSFIKNLNNLPNWDCDKAFIWITFSDDIAMQSKNKFNAYFFGESENTTLTVSDINRGKLLKNDIMFLNWQKIVSKSAENRILRRPDDNLMRKEIGDYFEDLIDKTHLDKRDIILIVDEAHKNAKTKLSQDIVNYINPKVITYVTATPSEKIELEARRENGYVEVERSEVVDEGLIKESIVIQTDEDLALFSECDLDETLLRLAIEKRKTLKKEYESLNKNVNPLLLIQLPNDDKKLIDFGEKTKEQIVLDYLYKNGIQEDEIAFWFDGKQKNMEFITENDSEINYMLFKQAAGTGWDCPRAHVLVMFREINSATFYVQTVGRILRMAEIDNIAEYKNSKNLRTGFLYTNYKRDEVEIPDQSQKNQPLTIEAKKRFDTEDLELLSDYIPRVDYGDLGSSSKFQLSFIKSMNTYFEINERDILGTAINKLEKYQVAINPHLTNQVIVDANFEDFDNLAYEFKTKGHDVNIEMSKNDVEKTFNFYCYKLLQEQTDEEAKISNIARSWGPFKAALRVWLRSVFSQESDFYYRVFINDIRKNASSRFRSAITFSLKEYKPILNNQLEEKMSKLIQTEKNYFVISDSYYYPDSYDIRVMKLCVLDKYCSLNQYNGKINEDDFIEYIESREDAVEWWFKNGDYGKNYFAIEYFNTSENKKKLFYPDWILKSRKGQYFIFDTKSGITLQNMNGRETALAMKLKVLGSKFDGGIVSKRNGTWSVLKINDQSGKIDKWVELSILLDPLNI